LHWHAARVGALRMRSDRERVRGWRASHEDERGRPELALDVREEQLHGLHPLLHAHRPAARLRLRQPVALPDSTHHELVTRRDGRAAAGPTAAAGSARRPQGGAGRMPPVQASRAPPLASLPRVPRRASAPTRRERPRRTQRGGVHRRVKKQKAKTKTKTKTARTAAHPRRRGGVARGSARRGPRAAACGGT